MENNKKNHIEDSKNPIKAEEKTEDINLSSKKKAEFISNSKGDVIGKKSENENSNIYEKPLFNEDFVRFVRTILLPFSFKNLWAGRVIIGALHFILQGIAFVFLMASIGHYGPFYNKPGLLLLAIPIVFLGIRFFFETISALFSINDNLLELKKEVQKKKDL